MKREDKLGQLKKGFYADIIAVKGKLDEKSASKLKAIEFVMKNGVIYKQAQKQ